MHRLTDVKVPRARAMRPGHRAAILLVARIVFALAIVVTIATVLSPPTPAYAATLATGDGCKKGPTPATPGDAAGGNIDNGPAKPAAGDPFAKDAAASIYDRYGYAGVELHRYEVDKVGPICQPFSFDAQQMGANVAGDAAKYATAVTVRGTRLVTDGDLGSLWDPVQQGLLRTVGGRLFVVGTSLAALAGIAYAAAVWASKGQIRHIAGWMGRVLAIVTIGTMCVFYAVGVGGAVDNGIRQAFTSAGALVAESTGGDAADVVGRTMVDHVLYPTWERQMFGSDRKAAAEYGPRLFKAGALTREEQAGIAADPDSATALHDTKRAEYEKTMTELEQRHPGAYDRAAGMQGRAQLGEALVGLTGVAVGAWFLLLCLARILWGMVLVRVGVGLFPAVAVPAVLPGFHGTAMAVLGMIVKAGWLALLSAFAFFGFIVAILVPIVSSDRDPLVRSAAVLIAAYAMHTVMKVFRLAPNRDGKGPLARFKRSHATGGDEQPETAPVRAPGTPVTVAGARPPAVRSRTPVGASGQRPAVRGVAAAPAVAAARVNPAVAAAVRGPALTGRIVQAPAAVAAGSAIPAQRSKVVSSHSSEWYQSRGYKVPRPRSSPPSWAAAATRTVGRDGIAVETPPGYRRGPMWIVTPAAPRRPSYAAAVAAGQQKPVRQPPVVAADATPRKPAPRKPAKD